jgi:hypothetical protein
MLFKNKKIKRADQILSVVYGTTLMNPIPYLEEQEDIVHLLILANTMHTF